MNILLRGAGFENKGAEAMLRTVQREVGRRVSETCFHIFVPSPTAQFANVSGLFSITEDFSLRKRILGAIPLVSRYKAYFLKVRNPDFARAEKISRSEAYRMNRIKSIDAIIDISGYAYGDAWNASRCMDTWVWLDYCLHNNKPYIFLPQAFGPFEKTDIAQWARKLCENATLLFARDKESFRHIASLCHKRIDNIRIAPDIVFRFQGAHPNAGASVLRNLGFEFGKRPLVGLVPNMRVYERTSGIGVENNYVQLLIEIANYCIEELEVSVLLLPNEIRIPGDTEQDDRFLCGIIQSLINRNEFCFTIREYYPCEIIKSILNHLELLIASRFHSLVFTLSAGIPVMALGWAHKYLELLRSFGLSDYVCYHDQLDRTAVIGMLNKAWVERENSKKSIADALPTIYKEVDTMFDLVAEAIRV
jgi:polysaccharide pyruvyl transferase WcaK-like protein